MSLISPNLIVSLSFFPQFWSGPFPKIAGKSPDVRKPIYIDEALYSKTCLKRPLKNRQNKDLNDMVA